MKCGNEKVTNCMTTLITANTEVTDMHSFILNGRRRRKKEPFCFRGVQKPRAIICRVYTILGVYYTGGSVGRLA